MIEGGTSMKLLIRAPDSLKIETRKGLSGPPRGKPRGAPKKLREEIELGKDGWQAIPDQPDRWKTASE